jgi:hypothetical protein
MGDGITFLVRQNLVVQSYRGMIFPQSMDLLFVVYSGNKGYLTILSFHNPNFLASLSYQPRDY